MITELSRLSLKFCILKHELVFSKLADGLDCQVGGLDCQVSQGQELWSVFFICCLPSTWKGTLHIKTLKKWFLSE